MKESVRVVVLVVMAMLIGFGAVGATWGFIFYEATRCSNPLH